MLCRADSVGVFQVESRAQMATLPRLRPRTFYDLVVEVALIRPGPDPGRLGAPLHPPPQRPGGGHLPAPAAGAEPGEDARRPAVPGAAHADGHRRGRLHAGRGRPAPPGHGLQAQRRAHGAAAPALRRRRRGPGRAPRGGRADLAKLAAFANYGFPESHSVSFAYLVYASSWLKRYYPAAFCAALLDAQPMGFYSPHTLVQDARRHGVEVRTPDLNASAATATLEPPRSCDPSSRMSSSEVTRTRGAPPETWGHGGPAVRLGIVVGAGDRRRPGRGDRRRPALRRPGGPGPPRAAHAAPARGAGHRRRLRLLRPRPAGRRCGRRGRSPRWPAVPAGRCGCRASSPG